MLISFQFHQKILKVDVLVRPKLTTGASFRIAGQPVASPSSVDHLHETNVHHVHGIVVHGPRIGCASFPKTETPIPGWIQAWNFVQPQDVVEAHVAVAAEPLSSWQ